MAYGAKGRSGAVPSNSILFFDITLVEILAESPEARLLDAAVATVAGTRVATTAATTTPATAPKLLPVAP